MTLAAGPVGIHRRFVSRHDLLCSMTAGTFPVGCMVILVAGGTRGGVGSGSQAHRALVARYTGDFVVRSMRKAYFSSPRAVAGDGHLDGYRFGFGDLGILMAGGAVTHGGTLMMADLTATWDLERQRAALSAKIVAGEAGESAMTLVGEGVARGGHS
jgi:hypothetical protein